MDSVLSFIFFLIVGFYLAGLLGRLLLRRWIIRKQKEFEQGGNPFFRTYTWGGGGHSRNAKPKPEGKVTVEGHVAALEYGDAPSAKRGGLLSRMFR